MLNPTYELAVADVITKPGFYALTKKEKLTDFLDSLFHHLNLPKFWIFIFRWIIAYQQV
jgi:hypothetical protein